MHTHKNTHTGITAGCGDHFEKITLHFTVSFPFTFIKVCRDLNHCTQQNGNLKLSVENRTLKTEWTCLLDYIIKLLKRNTWTHQFLDLFWGNKSQLFVSPLVSLLWLLCKVKLTLNDSRFCLKYHAWFIFNFYLDKLMLTCFQNT